MIWNLKKHRFIFLYSLIIFCTTFLTYTLDAAHQVTPQLDSKSHSSLINAVYKGQRNKVKALLGAKANPNEREKIGITETTPLHGSVMRGDWTTASTLLHYKADVNAQQGNHDGLTPLMIASKLGYSKCVDTLLSHKADPTQAASMVSADPIFEGLQGTTALHESIYSSNIRVIKSLLSAKSNIGAKRMDQVTPLMLAYHLLHLSIRLNIVEEYPKRKGVYSFLLNRQKKASRPGPKRLKSGKGKKRKKHFAPKKSV